MDRSIHNVKVDADPCSSGGRLSLEWSRATSRLAVPFAASHRRVPSQCACWKRQRRAWADWRRCTSHRGEGLCHRPNYADDVSWMPSVGRLPIPQKAQKSNIILILQQFIHVLARSWTWDLLTDDTQVW